MAQQPDNSVAAIAIAIFAHAVVIAALTFSLPLQTRPRGSVVVPIEAVLDTEALARETARLEQEAADRERERREAEEVERQKQEEVARQEREAEQRRQEEVARQQREAEQAEAAEQQRQEELARQEREAEQQRQEELARQEREAEQRRQEELARQEREAEQRRQEELAQQKRIAQEAREADLQRALLAEQAANRARDSGLEDEYVRSIQNKIEQHWRRPPGAGAGIECVVTVTQIRSGDVTDVVVGRCNGDETLVRSVENAVLAASPLPRPPVPEVFQRTLVITFKPDDAL